MGQSVNKTVIASLIETLQRKVEPAKLYDALRKIADDLAKTYDALFFGPLPTNSGKNLDLTEVPLDKYNPDLYTPFDEDQLIVGENKSWLVRWESPGVTSTGAYARVTQTADGTAIFSLNLNDDGSGLDTDSGDSGALLKLDNQGNVSIIQVITDVVYTYFKLTRLRFLLLMGATITTGATTKDIIIPNDVTLRAENAALTSTHLLVKLDTNNLVQLGSNPTGATTGEGNISIPRAVTADMPAAGGTRNGILIIDKTDDTLAYYVDGLRYKLTGVVF